MLSVSKLRCKEHNRIIFESNWSPKTKNCVNETTMQKIKTLVADNYAMQYQKSSELIAVFWKFPTIKHLMQATR